MADPKQGESGKPAGGKSRKGAETRARLVEAAKVVFERDGFLEARITDIAKEAGVSHGSYYHYFESKEQLFREVALLQEERLTAPPDDPSTAVGHDAPLSVRIEEANRRYLERYRDEAALMGVIEQVSRYDAPVREVRAERFRFFAGRSEAAIRRWQEEGKVDPAVDPVLAADALGAMVARFAELWLVQEYADYDFDHVVEQLSLLWSNALGLHDAPTVKTRKQ
ncbi:MAG: TetR/AcrR family transcriptional regulator [Acidimicrobiia bacterium]